MCLCYNLCLMNIEENTMYLHLYRYISEIISPIISPIIEHVPITIIIVGTYLQMKILINIV